MGADKFSLAFRGLTFLENAARALAEVCENRVKIVANRTQNFAANYEIVRDVYTERGALGGIHAALRSCAREYAVILAVDLPFVTGETVKKLAAIALESKDYAAIVPRQTDGRVQPLCAVYRVKDCLPPLEKLLAKTENASNRDFLKTINPKFVEQNLLAADSDRDIFHNVNTRSDFQKI